MANRHTSLPRPSVVKIGIFSQGVEDIDHIYNV
jgi:hypothetical protein